MRYLLNLIYGGTVFFGIVILWVVIEEIIDGIYEDPIFGTVMGIGLAVSALVSNRSLDVGIPTSLKMFAGLLLVFFGIGLFAIELDALFFGKSEDAIWGFVTGGIMIALGAPLVYRQFRQSRQPDTVTAEATNEMNDEVVSGIDSPLPPPPRETEREK